MKNYKDISLRYLKHKRKQSKFIMLSIILAITLITCILTGLLTFNNMMKENACKMAGEYDFKINSLNNDKIENIKSNDCINKLGIETIVDNAKLSNIDIKMVNYDNELINMKSKTLKEGRLPQANDEIALEIQTLELIDSSLNLNDFIELYINGNIKRFKIVGILENAYISEDIKTALVNYNCENNLNSQYNVYVLINDKFKLEEVIDDISSRLDINKTSIERNSFYISATFKGEMEGNLAIIAIVMFICIVVVSASITVINNAIKILLLERTKDLAIIKAVGGNKKQIKKIIRYEILIITLISIPIGIVLGLILIKGILIIINNTVAMNLDLIISFKVIIGTIILGIISVSISLRKPLIIINKISPLQAISNLTNATDIKNKKGILYKYLFITNKIAYKNMKQNRKKFINTLISITISLILFISFYSLITYGFKLIDFSTNMGEIHSDICITNESLTISEKESIYENKDGFTEEYYNALSNIDGVKHVYRKNIKYVSTSFKYDKLTHEYINILNNNNETINNYNNKQYFFTTSSGFYGYDNKQLNDCKNYLIEGEVDIESMNSENGVIIVENSLMVDSKDNKTKNISIANFKVGDEIFIDFNLSSNTKIYEENLNNKVNIDNKEFKKVKVVGIISDVPYDRKNPSSGIGVIATTEIYNKLTNRNTSSGFEIELDPSMDKHITTKKIKDFSNTVPNSRFRDFNEINKLQKEYYIQISTFLYGIASIVFIIGILNIGNTISTNILLKSKEFAVLKAIGTSPKKLNKMILLESSYYGVLGSIYGSIIGILISFGIYKVCFEIVRTLFVMGRITNFTYEIPWIAILISITFTIASCLISSITPLRRLSENNIIDKIKEE